MVALSQDFEHGTNGTTLTGGSGGNTAGTGESFLDSVTIGTGGTLAFSSTQSAHGSLACAIATGTTSAATFMTWAASLGTVTTHWGRAYVFMTAAPGASDAFIQFQTSGLSWNGGLQLTTARQILVQLPSFATANTFTTVMSLSTWYRIEWKLVNSTTTGQIIVSLYAGDSTTATETYTSPATQNWGANVGAVLFGWTGAHASQPTVYVDDIALSTTAALGPASSASTPALPDVAGAAEALTATATGGPGETAGAADAISVSSTTLPALPEAGGAADALGVVITGFGIVEAEPAGSADKLSVAVSLTSPQRDAAGAGDGLQVTIGGAPTPVPGTAIKLASPAFIRSQVPRMHVQNLITGQWVHRDVQGITSPQITWALNTADAFSCTLAPPRADMMDASGNAIVVEWRDAIYLEESDEIKFGGICTQSQLQGPAWQLTAMGFSGYPNGMPYEGANFTRTNLDALDAVRFIWNWLQSQPGGNIGMELGTAKAGILLGNQVAPGIQDTIAAKAAAGAKSVWLANAQAFNGNENITISGIPYSLAGVVHNSENIATGQVNLTRALGEPHAIGDPVAQVSPVFTRLARVGTSGANNIWLGESGPFASGEVITVGGDTYTVGTIATDTKGGVTGNITITPNLKKTYPIQTPVIQVRTITPFDLFWYNSTDLGQEIQSIQQEAVFDFREFHFWADPNRNTVRHQIQFGVPRLGTRLTGLRFAEGENIIQAVTVTRDGTKYASNVVGLGAGSGSAQIRVSVASANTGRLRRTYIYTDQTVNTIARLATKAQKVLSSMQNIDMVTAVVVKNHPNAPFGSFRPGDDIPVMLASGWRNTTIWSRITQMTQDPTTDLMTLTLARSDSFTYIAQTGQAGTL